MIFLWALVLITKVVGMVVNNLSQASDDTDSTQVFTFEEQPLSNRQKFVVTLVVRKNVYISEDALSESIALAFEGLCLIPFGQYLGTRDYTPAGRQDLSIKVTESPSTAGALTTKYTMGALFLCFAQLMQAQRPQPLALYSAQCAFGLRDPGSSGISTLLGKVEFVPGVVEGSAISSSGNSASVPDISVVRRIKQRANAADAGASSTDPDQETISASSNATGWQGSLPLGNLTSDNRYTFNRRGTGAIIPLDPLLISILEALIDRASQPRNGPVNARIYTPQVGNYIVLSRPAPGITLNYPTVPGCFIELLKFLNAAPNRNIREGDWICIKNFQEVLQGTFTKKPGGNAGIAAPLTGEASGSVDVTRRNYQ
ncbi:MAG: hypothetical protein OHK93_002738 [Ramalina farinacea]|uniref:Uncharacterized protein n=1 Tax=Ramalina farinacea TaxID=258253 RepID=A0AA43QTR7_9LECA|nr:hypothetical protein [Ramalina farinacea]